MKALAKMGSLPRKSILKNSKDGLLSAHGDQVSHFPPLYPRQGVRKRCRLSWLTNSALVYEPKRGVSANEYSCAHGTQKKRIRHGYGFRQSKMMVILYNTLLYL